MLGWQDALIAGAGATLIQILRYLPAYAYQFFLFHFTRRINVYEDDPGYTRLCSWLREHVTDPRTYQLVRVIDRIVSVPGLGFHYMRYHKTWVTVQSKMTHGEMRMRHVLAITLWTKKSAIREHLLQLLRDDATFKVHVAIESWFRTFDRESRPLSSVITPWNDYVLTKCQTFMASRSWYVNQGIPWRTAFLFHGPPRNGKTSLVHALASHLQLQIYVLSPETQSDAQILQSLSWIPSRAIVLIEDIGAPWNPNTQTGSSGTTQACLLNIIDGIVAPVGVIIFATTNHPDNLPDALKQRFEMLEFPEIDPAALTPEEYQLIAAGQNRLEELKA